MTTIDDLPDEILIKIFSYIQVQQRQHLATVCKQWESIVESMWQSVHKLIINIGVETYSYSGMESANCANILCSTIPRALEVLKKFNGNLTKLDFVYSYVDTTPCTFNEIEWKELCKEIQKNEQLNSIRIDDFYFKDEIMCLQFLQCIPTKNLQYLVLDVSTYEPKKEFVAIFEKLVKETSGLKYLSLEKYTPRMEKIIDDIDTLESFHVTQTKLFEYYNCSLPNISKFPNLKELTVCDEDLIDNELLISLGDNGNSLHALQLSLSSTPINVNLSQAAFDCIGKLENLTQLYLSLGKNRNLDMLRHLLNLEELYIEVRRKIHFSEIISSLKYILKQLPKLKQCWFYNDEIHEALKLMDGFDEFKLEEPQNLQCITWKRIFGIPYNYS